MSRITLNSNFKSGFSNTFKKTEPTSNQTETLLPPSRVTKYKLKNLERENAELLEKVQKLEVQNRHLEGQLKTYEILLKEFEKQFKSQEQNFEKRFETAIKSITSESINWRNQYQDEIGRLISSSTDQFARLHHRFYRIMKREAFLTEKLKRERLKNVGKEV